MPHLLPFCFPIAFRLDFWLPIWSLNGVFGPSEASFCSNPFENFLIVLKCSVFFYLFIFSKIYSLLAFSILDSLEAVFYHIGILDPDWNMNLDFGIFRFIPSLCDCGVMWKWLAQLLFVLPLGIKTAFPCWCDWRRENFGANQMWLMLLAEQDYYLGQLRPTPFQNFTDL